ncbi:Aste57867_14240 [Aphanomyces stellatus]|uniref:Aste57867_14240 protein n=1 Tax=Aphanomyces stellatus TaxID=120398 RepID=A0A485L1U7_9STRA|nr:hypothetical protein As57867_014189 [Aphanomyces stellatus]VFT91065.1 Aste57867_14240 [Aphanomyces stellatus]
MIAIGRVHVAVEQQSCPPRGSYRIETSDEFHAPPWRQFPVERPLWQALLRMVDGLGAVLTLERPHDDADSSDEDVWVALDIQVAFHDAAFPRKPTWIREHDYVLQHFEAALVDQAEGVRPAALHQATMTSCHVIGCRVHAPSMTSVLSSGFNLPSLFKRLESPLEAAQMGIRDDAAYVDRLTSGRTLVLTDLPMNAIWDVLKYLNAKEIARMSRVCSLLQHVTYDTVPGLRLTLFPHQKKALKWMLFRESRTHAQLTQEPHPYVIGGLVDPVFGRVFAHPAECEAQDTRGGFLCDEPGLGKTITMISLLLRTQGTVANPTALHTTTRHSNYGLRANKRARRSAPTDQLRPSHASLVIVPDTLMSHWAYQIQQHTTGLHLLLDNEKKVPDPDTMVLFDVVVTTFGRLATHWLHHRPLSELEARRPDRLGYEDQQKYADGVEHKSLSPLLQLHWVRIIVDEGHKLGGTAITNAMQMLCSLSAEKRWIMTGTPTPHVAQSDGLRHLHGLLRFLQERPYGTDDDKPWLQAIARPFEAKCVKGYLRLEALLNRIMLRHVKTDVRSIPTPIYLHTIVDPTPVEYRIYNGVVGAIRGNLVVTKWDPEFPGSMHKDSLINPDNRKDAMTAVSNLRLASCGGGTMEVLLSREHFVETINFFDTFQMDWDRRVVVQDYMRDAQQGKCTPCEDCRRHLQLLMVTVCGHLICADCVERHVTTHGFEEPMQASCQVCGALYDWENFQRLQPGFDYKWNTDEPIPPTFAAEMAVAAAAGQHLHHPAAAAATDDDEHIWSSSKGLYVLERIQTLLAPPPSSSMPPHYGGPKPTRPIKCIVFSDFPEHIFRIRPEFQRAGLRYVSFVTGEANMVKRLQQLQTFRDDSDMHVLFMTEIGAVGLDLSFVTHIFLMDEIWDKSVEQQVIARAHRMGATDSVVVEQLEMRGSMEDLVRELLSVAQPPKKTPAARSTESGKQRKKAKSSAKSTFRVMSKESMSSLRLYHVLENVQMIESCAERRTVTTVGRATAAMAVVSPRLIDVVKAEDNDVASRHPAAVFG